MTWLRTFRYSYRTQTIIVKILIMGKKKSKKEKRKKKAKKADKLAKQFLVAKGKKKADKKKKKRTQLPLQKKKSQQ